MREANRFLKRDNLSYMKNFKPLSEEEQAVIRAAQAALNADQSIPCTGCRYCTEGCPMELDIPMLIAAYNDLKFTGGGITVSMQMDVMAEDKLPSACIGCGACTAICPQQIDIPAAMQDFAARLAATPTWAEICRQREEAAKKLAGK